MRKLTMKQSLVMIDTSSIPEPHKNNFVLQSGEDLKNSQSAMILIHGRGATAESMLSFAEEFDANNICFLAPQASNGTWYPNSFITPRNLNEPGISSSLKMIELLVAEIKKNSIPDEKIFILGFSQGACLALEFAAKNSGKYGGILGLSGGLIGDVIEQEEYASDLKNTPVFIGCSDIDFHIPLERVKETARIFSKLNANVTERIYTGMGHTVNEDEIKFIKNMLK